MEIKEGGGSVAADFEISALNVVIQVAFVSSRGSMSYFSDCQQDPRGNHQTSPLLERRLYTATQRCS